NGRWTAPARWRRRTAACTTESFASHAGRSHATYRAVCQGPPRRGQIDRCRPRRAGIPPQNAKGRGRVDSRIRSRRRFEGGRIVKWRSWTLPCFLTGAISAADEPPRLEKKGNEKPQAQKKPNDKDELKKPGEDKPPMKQPDEEEAQILERLTQNSK